MISRWVLSEACMHVWPFVYYYARATRNNQGNYTSRHEGGHSNLSVNEQTAMYKPVIEAGSPYYFILHKY